MLKATVIGWIPASHSIMSTSDLGLARNEFDLRQIREIVILAVPVHP